MFFLSEGMMARQKKSAPRVHRLLSPSFHGEWAGENFAVVATFPPLSPYFLAEQDLSGPG